MCPLKIKYTHMNTLNRIQLNEEVMNQLEHLVLPGDISALPDKIAYLTTHYEKWQNTIARLESRLLQYQTVARQIKR